MNAKIEKIEQDLVEFYRDAEIPQQLALATTYSLTAGGKRIRPLLLLALLESFDVRLTPAHFKVAASVEMIHTGSLIHDDLPAMDNDDYRRGKLTNHKQFDEATAILAGDALFLDPYMMLSNTDLSAEIEIQLVRELSYASGSFGMVAGQVLDMDGEGKVLDLAQIEQIHRLKTGRLLTFPFVAAGIIAEKSSDEIKKLRQIGQEFGLAFQIRDDIIDVTATFEELGKTPGKDVIEEKSTYVRLLGIDGAKLALKEHLATVKQNLTTLSNSKNSQIFEIIESLNVK